MINQQGEGPSRNFVVCVRYIYFVAELPFAVARLKLFFQIFSRSKDIFIILKNGFISSLTPQFVPLYKCKRNEYIFATDRVKKKVS